MSGGRFVIKPFSGGTTVDADYVARSLSLIRNAIKQIQVCILNRSLAR